MINYIINTLIIKFKSNYPCLFRPWQFELEFEFLAVLDVGIIMVVDLSVDAFAGTTITCSSAASPPPKTLLLKTDPYNFKTPPKTYSSTL